MVINDLFIFVGFCFSSIDEFVNNNLLSRNWILTDFRLGSRPLKSALAIPRLVNLDPRQESVEVRGKYGSSYVFVYCGFGRLKAAVH